MASKKSPRTLLKSSNEGQVSLAESLKAARAGNVDVVGVESEATYMWPGTINTYMQGWALVGNPKLEAIFKKCRQAATRGGFIEMLLFYKKTVFADGLNFTLGDKPTPAQKKWLESHEEAMRDAVSDFITEWMICDNGIVLWKENDGIPEVMIPDSENAQFTSFLGTQSLKIKLPKTKLTAAQKRDLGPRYSEALEAGRQIVWGEEEDEHSRVKTRGKKNGGLAYPRLFAIFDELSAMDLLRKGDWNLAWRAKDVARQYKRGHEVKQGPLAGQPVHFLKSKQAAKIRAEMKTKEGVYDLVTNFDAMLTYAFLDPKAFDDIRTQGLMRRLREWGGPLASMLCEANNNPSPDWIKLLEIEGNAERLIYRQTFETIFNDPTFFKGSDRLPKGSRIQVTFNPNTFTSTKMLLEKLRLAGGSGWVSSQTAREELGYDNDRESIRNKEAAKDREAYSPPFEAKQGLSSAKGTTGGRPQGAPDPKAGE